MMGALDILRLDDVANEWQEKLDEMGASVPNTEGMSWGELSDATEAFLAAPEQKEYVKQYEDLCAGLGCEPTPDDLRRWGNDYDSSLIADDYFEDYARELAEDIGAIGSDARWPATCIDWERAADELRMDYTSVEYDGDTYWYRG